MEVEPKGLKKTETHTHRVREQVKSPEDLQKTLHQREEKLVEEIRKRRLSKESLVEVIGDQVPELNFS